MALATRAPPPLPPPAPPEAASNSSVTHKLETSATLMIKLQRCGARSFSAHTPSLEVLGKPQDNNELINFKPKMQRPFDLIQVPCEKVFKVKLDGK